VFIFLIDFYAEAIINILLIAAHHTSKIAGLIITHSLIAIIGTYNSRAKKVNRPG
jgi:hypothetical protein